MSDRSEKLDFVSKITSGLPKGAEEFLVITENKDAMETHWRRCSAIVLRRYSGENGLVVGCGNSPFSLGNLSLKEKISNPWIDDFNKDHVHNKMYTISTETGHNPSMIAEFGKADIAQILQKESFETVTFERPLIGPLCNVNIIRTLIHLLKNGGMVYLSNSVDIITIAKKVDGALVMEDGTVAKSDSVYTEIFSKIMAPKI